MSGTTATFEVAGMACRTCADAVTAEVELLHGVSAVRVDVASGTMAVTSEWDLDPAAVRAAVRAAGYEIA